MHATICVYHPRDVVTPDPNMEKSVVKLLDRSERHDLPLDKEGVRQGREYSYSANSTSCADSQILGRCLNPAENRLWLFLWSLGDNVGWSKSGVTDNLDLVDL
jgi:hypothetical protein